MSWQQLHDAIEDRAGGWHVQVAEIRPHRCRIERPIKFGPGYQRLQFRTEADESPILIHEEGFDAHSITNQRQLMLVRVPNRNRKHPNEFLNRSFDSPLLEGSQSYLGI